MTETLQSVMASSNQTATGFQLDTTSVFSQTTIQKILFVTPRYLPTVGGVQNHVYQVSRRLAHVGIDVTVLTTNPGNRLPAEEVIENVRIRRVPAWPANRDYYFAPQMVPIIRSGSWDIIHVQSYHTFVAPLAMWAAWRSGKPFVTTFHGGGHSSQLRNNIRGAQQLMLRPLLARANKLIAISDFEIPLFSERLKLPETQFTLIPNGADLPNVNSMEGESAQVEAGLIVSIGRLEQYKGHQRVIAALPKILEQRPDAHLWIAGAGPYESELRKLANQLGVADRVDIHAVPAADRQRMAQELSRAALVVLLSEFETHPIAILEAVSLGRPALVTDTSGLRELAQKGLARAIPLRSTSSQVANAILDQLQQPQIPGNVNLQTWDECTAGLLSLYISIVAGRTACTS
jgi:glycosyltransferase involved in cell wall biosynthesis